jgi:1,2-phenylacetyl-CoA epoxidase catalytic subunit
MAYLLVTYFGEDGRTAARELLERRATRGEAQLEMFNIKLNWVDVFSWHNWGDRVGKYQLTMFGGCAFAPFARSIAPMLKEEGFHLVIGHQGLQRIAAAGRVPVELHQRYLNRMMWICYEAFGGEVSRRAARIHDWGLKAPWGADDADPARSNERVRTAFIEEVRKLLRLIDPRLQLPDPHGPKENLPTEQDEATLQQILRTPGWIAAAA